MAPGRQDPNNVPLSYQQVGEGEEAGHVLEAVLATMAASMVCYLVEVQRVHRDKLCKETGINTWQMQAHTAAAAAVRTAATTEAEYATIKVVWMYMTTAGRMFAGRQRDTRHQHVLQPPKQQCPAQHISSANIADAKTAQQNGLPQTNKRL